MRTEDWKETYNKAVEVGKKVVYISWIPLVIYLGYIYSVPRPSLHRLLNPIS